MNFTDVIKKETPGFIKFKEKDVFKYSMISSVSLALINLFYIPLDISLNVDFALMARERIYATISFLLFSAVILFIRRRESVMRFVPFIIMLTATFYSARIVCAAGVSSFLYWGGFLQILFCWFFVFPQKPVTSILCALIYILLFDFIVMEHTGFNAEVFRTAVYPGNVLVFGTFIIGIITSILFYASRLNLYHSKLKIELEQDKNEQLLHNILPSEIAKKLKESDATIADSFSSVAILFADIVNFTSFCVGRDSCEIVTILNQIFYAFDKKTEELHLEKIKTIGDGYMVMAGGLESVNHDLLKTIDLGRFMISFIKQFNEENGFTFGIRVGIHIGSVTAGVIGKTKFAFDVWGDTVNIASRMESTGISMCINVTEQVASMFPDQSTVSYRGEVDIKGIGKQKAFIIM